jgi:hypothetical protein
LELRFGKKQPVLVFSIPDIYPEQKTIEMVTGCLSGEASIAADGADFGHLLLFMLAIRALKNDGFSRLPIGHGGPTQTVKIKFSD